MLDGLWVFVFFFYQFTHLLTYCIKYLSGHWPCSLPPQVIIRMDLPHPETTQHVCQEVRFNTSTENVGALAPSLLSQERTVNGLCLVFLFFLNLSPTAEKVPQGSFSLWTDVVHEPRTLSGT